MRDSPRRRSYLVYDGDCGFCTASAHWIAARWHGRATAASWQELGDEGLARLGLSRADVRAAAWWVDGSGRRDRGHAAVARAAIASGGWKAVLGYSSLVPPLSWCAAAAYAIVARNRHRLPGGTGACRL
jgi:predicted DCC family thiol-disulfide oxidoreductase YuxK